MRVEQASGGACDFVADALIPYGAAVLELGADWPADADPVMLVVDEATDPALRRAFELRERLGDRDFLSVWRYQARWVARLDERRPLVRLDVRIHAPEPFEHRFIVDPHQLKTQLQAANRPGAELMLVPRAVALREAARRVTSGYELLTAALPVWSEPPSDALSSVLTIV